MAAAASPTVMFTLRTPWLLLALVPLALLSPAHSSSLTHGNTHTRHVAGQRQAQLRAHMHRELLNTGKTSSPSSSSAASSATDAGAASGASTRPDACTALQQRLAVYSRTVPATKSNGFLFARPLDILPCTRSVPFNAKRDLVNLRSVILYFRNFYSLLHIAKRAPDARVPSNYDVVAQLAALGSRKWAAAEDFYNAMSAAVRGLNDGHTALMSSCPPFYHALALPVVGVVENGRPVVRVAPEQIVSQFITTAAVQAPPFRFNMKPYFGARVLSIDGAPAWPFMVRWANLYSGTFHDLGQRLNAAFASTAWSSGTRTASPGAFAFRTSNPRTNFVRMTLIRKGSIRPEIVAVPWLSLTDSQNLPGFANRPTYFAGFCSAQALTGSASGSKKRRPTVHINGGAKVPMLMTPQGEEVEPSAAALAARNAALQSLGKLTEASRRGTLENIAQRAAEGVKGKDIPVHPMHRVHEVPGRFRVKPATGLTGLLLSAVGQDRLAGGAQLSGPSDLFPVYLLKDGKTGVVAVNTFMLDSGPDDNPVVTIINEAIKALNLANSRASRLIIDLSGNGGGIPLAGWWLISLVAGSRRFPAPRSRMQDLKDFLADSKLIPQLVQANAGYFAWSGNADSLERAINARTRTHFLKPFKVRKSGPRGFQGRYTNFFKLAEPSLAEAANQSFTSSIPGKPVMLFSDGGCFSTCLNFAFFLKHRFGVPLVTVGGIPGRPMQFGGGGGGFILSDVESQMLSAIPTSLSKRSYVPKPFTVRLSMSMRFAQGFYSADSVAPIEFTYSPGDHRIDYTLANIQDPTLQYLEVAKFFAQGPKKAF